ncbi:hypothetical protein HK405_006825, partial [Cladochytrium tenue]
MAVLNRECVELAIKAALALSSRVSPTSSFDRKHYFYPDLPAGFQITQHRDPIARGGYLDIGPFDGLSYKKRVYIEQIQLEQDSGKTVNSISGHSMVDFNRAGVGVLEIVTAPDLRSADEAVAFMKKMQRLLWYTGVSSPEMGEGAWRCDVNVSVRKLGSTEFGNRTEMKHISKFSTVKEFEVARQIGLLERGVEVQAETRGVDEKSLETFFLRGKEDSPDYR